tara:strand:- start:876 stop:2750 length:1875 start_codon:yes stop_codon:yes gene_type:complete
MKQEETARNIMSGITHYLKYAKYIGAEQRKETWEETVNRNRNMHLKKMGHLGPEVFNEINRIYDDFVMTRKVLPSMRSMQYAGKPIEIAPNSIYNCAYLPIDDIACFHEIFFLLLNGTGVGFSVQRHHTIHLPEIRKPNPKRSRKIVVQDSIVGWADAIKELFRSYTGELTQSPRFIYDDIRPMGAPLKTRGGKAPGPEPLIECMTIVENMLRVKEDGDRLTPLECHDIICHMANAVTAGGNRRAALISLFSADDHEMQTCKSGQWWDGNSQRARSNNSAVILRSKVTKDYFNELWDKIEESGSGEPGIYFTHDKDWGTNPCCEIALRPYQFCNLTEINANTVEDDKDLYERVEAATILGTLQASYTDFYYLRDIWRETTERDALLGVSMTGIASQKTDLLDVTGAALKAKEVNKKWADILGINPASRITCVKPSGTSSMVLGTSSGIHAWHSEYYIRRIRIGKEEPIYNYLLQNHPELIDDEDGNPAGAVIEIPQKAPDHALTADKENAFEFLERVKNMTIRWVNPGHSDGQNTHNISATVYIKDGQWDEVGEWMWLNRHYYNGLSCYPEFAVYKQAPFEACDKATYEKMLQSLKDVDLTKIVEYDDSTDFSDPACGGGGCDI